MDDLTIEFMFEKLRELIMRCGEKRSLSNHDTWILRGDYGFWAMDDYRSQNITRIQLPDFTAIVRNSEQIFRLGEH